MKKLLVSYYEDFGRSGDLSDIFVCTEKELEALKSFGELYWHEKLGKHSEGSHDFDDETLTVLTDDQEFIVKAIEYGIVQKEVPFSDSILDDLVSNNSGNDPEDTGKNWDPEDKEIYLALGGRFEKE